MRFASLGGSNAGNYAAAGKSVADSAARMHAVQRKTGPDYTGLSKVAMQTASNEKIAGMQAEAKLTNVAQAQYARNTQNAINIKKFNKGEEIKNKQRKAGGLAAIGKIAGAGFLAATDNTKGRERPKADYSSINDSYKTKRDALMADYDSKLTSFTTTSPKESDAGKVTGGSSTVTPSEGTGIRSQAFNYLTGEKGLSKNKALGILANVDRESGWDPSIRSGDDGGPGGLFQWKGSRQTSTVAGLVDSGNWKGQLDYALNEPGEAFSQTYQNTTYDSPQQAADAWMINWERPADTTAGSKKHTNFLGGYSF